jgi:hypothetical protein
MHHPPFDIGVPSLDRIKLSDDKAFSEVVATACNLKHIFFGHVHRPVSGSWMGIPFSALRSTAHQVPLDMVTVDKVPYSEAAPQYGVIMIDERQTTVHLHDFLTDVPLPPMRERYQAIG